MFDNGDNQYFEPQCCDLCYIPRVWEIFRKKVKVLEFTSKEAAAPLISVAAPLWV